MSGVVKPDYATFLRAKVARLAAELRHDAGHDEFVQRFALPEGSSKSASELSLREARRIEQDVEWFARSALSREQMTSVLQGLRSEFGFERIGSDPAVVLRRVLRRGRIQGDEEAALVREFVASPANASLVGAAAFQQLASLVDQRGD